MDKPTFTMIDLLDSGVHFGHTVRRWNPKMKSYIFGSKAGVHIMDLQQTVVLLQEAIDFVYAEVSRGAKILFVGTKRAASDIIKEAAMKCGQYYVDKRWLGGMLTNWNTISKSIKKLTAMEEELENMIPGSMVKKELLKLTLRRNKLERVLGGIREMNGTPDVVFVIDTNKESIAIKEANKLGIPVIAIIDSNSTPEGVDYPIPGNDDATRSIQLYCDLISGAILSGIQAELIGAGIDIGESENFEPDEDESEIISAENTEA
jgi:small subunit ribosomal protein S2